MIKRIIFDIDGTLFHYKNSWQAQCKSFLESQNVLCTEEIARELIDTLEEYEATYSYYNEKEMLDYMRERLSYPIPNSLDFFNTKPSLDMMELYPNVKEALSYLSTKYELVILSNWISKTQLYRLEYFGIKEYFRECYFPEDFPKKPDPKAYEIAMGNYKIEECLMIGDKLDTDLKTPHQMGMKTLLFDPNKQYYNPFTKSFQDFKELKEIL